MTDYKQLMGMFVMSMIMKNETRIFDLIILYSNTIIIMVCIYWFSRKKDYFLNRNAEKKDVSITYTSRKIMTAAGTESISTCVEIKAITDAVVQNRKINGNVHCKRETATNWFACESILLLEQGEYILKNEEIHIEVTVSCPAAGQNLIVDHKYRVSSTTKKSRELHKWITDLCKMWKSNIATENHTKLFCFSFKESPDEKSQLLQFDCKTLSSEECPNYETFDFIVGSQKKIVLKLLHRLQNKQWYEQHGERHKEGITLAGRAGTGKTKIAVASALYLKRHLIIIDCKRIKNIQQLESILNIDCILDIQIKQENVIFLFEEFSMANFEKTLIAPDEKVTPCETKIWNPPKLDMNAMLTLFDGPRMYNGMLCMLTTNETNLDPRLIRDGRLKYIYFDFPTAHELKEFFQLHFLESIPIDVIVKWQKKYDDCSFAKAMTLVKTCDTFQDLLVSLQE